MPAPVFIIAAAATATVLGVSYFFSPDARTRRALKRQRVTPIAELRPGQLARVRGRVVVVEDTLEAPLSSRPCVYYLATLEESAGKGGWRLLRREERYVDFAIDDGSGRLHVCMSVPRVAVVHDLRTESGTFDDANAAQEAFLARHGLHSTNFLGLNRALRYVEGVLDADEEVTAYGLVRVEVREGARTLVLDAPDDGPLLLSDDPRAVQAP